MSIEVLAQHHAEQTARRALRLTDACSSMAMRCELLRSTVWALATPPSTSHVSRVLGSALAAWQLLSSRPAANEETLRGELRAALSALEDSGDLIDFGRGYWASATCRFVRLPNQAGFLLVGGVPTCLLPIDEVEYHGPHRRLLQLPPSLATAVPVEELNSWAGLPACIALQDWAKELIDSLERQPYLPSSSEPFEFYRPEEARSGTPQFKRWYDDPGRINGVLLARRTRHYPYPSREYRLVEIRAGRIVSVCELVGLDVRRLMYSLDQSAGKPVRALHRRNGATIEWVLTSEIPRAEQRVLATLGTLTIPDDRPYQRRWLIVRNEALARDLLEALGVQVVAGADEEEAAK